MKSRGIHAKLAEALSYLDIKDITLRDDKGEKIQTISAKDHAKALFSYFNLAGYLDKPLLTKAIQYLAAAKQFETDKKEDDIVKDLAKAIKYLDPDKKESSTTPIKEEVSKKLDVEHFLSYFAAEEYFSTADIIDLIVFLQQTAFDRQHGVERDRLSAKPWMESDEFKEVVKNLGIITPKTPSKEHYPWCGIMGAASYRVQKRLDYFIERKIDCDLAWALSGERELSKGLDEIDIMEEVAQAVRKKVNYVDKKQGMDTRTFLDGVTETMMVNYLISKKCPGKKIGVIDSSIQEGHWRATTAQNAASIVPIILKQITDKSFEGTKDGKYTFLIIAEQPYPGRMARQVQREFNKQIAQQNLKIQIEVEGCGSGVVDKELADKGYLARLNSELGALMAERYNDARLKLLSLKSSLREANTLLFSKRDETYKSNLEKDKSVVKQTQLTS